MKKHFPFHEKEHFPNMQKSLNLYFVDVSLLKLSMTHSSLSTGRRNIKNNQRLELLGDSILDLIVTEYLYQVYTNYQEGKITKIKNYLVSQPVLTEFGRILHLGNFLLLSHAEEVSGGRENESTLADAFEALVAAIYLDQGFEVARDFVLPLVKREMEKWSADQDFVADYKSELQYLVQKELKICPHYVVIRESGPHHDKLFKVALHIQDKKYAVGEGRTKKQAEQQAAKSLYQKLIEGLVQLGE